MEAGGAGPSAQGASAKAHAGALRWLAAIAVVGIAAAVGWITPELSRNEAVRNRQWLCLFGIAYVLFRTLRPATAARGLPTLLLALACTLGTVNYYRCDGSTFTEVGDYYDITYYYLNSKYFEELGYYDLYRAILLADEDGPGRLRGIRTVRDLHDYRNKPRATVMQDTAALRARFTDARWAAFGHDVDHLVRMHGAGNFGYFFRDHGYNPPPTWTLVGGTLSKLTPVEHLKRITSIDSVLIVAMGLIVLRTFGLEAMLLGLLFMTATLSGRWPVVGQALLRFDWLAATVIAMCALQRGRAATAGALLAYASMSRIFPAVFFLAPVVAFARNSFAARRITPEAMRFITAAGGVSAFMLGGAAVVLGGDAFVDSAHNLAMHASAESYSSLRVGLGDALIYRGERYWQLLHLTGSIPAKAEQLAALKPWTTLVFVAVVALVARYVWRLRDASSPVLPLAYFAFFAMTTPQINYHNSRLLLVLWHARGARPLRDSIGLCCLLGTELMGILAVSSGAITYTMTSLSSVGLTFYSLLMLGSLVAEHRGLAIPWERGRRVTLAAVLALAAMAGIGLSYWRAGALPPAEVRLTADEVATILPNGTRWPRDGGRAIDALGVHVDLGRVHHDPRIDLSVDHDDRDRLLFFRDDVVVGTANFKGRRRVGRGRLSRRRVEVPEEVARRGYDAVRVVPLRGDRRFAFGHLVPGPE